ncbi:hypothetical protein AAVH_24600 [Aphelenchoides avenae]|nr:hypothetical protein AAVH_24600 [Aphelenchus avenae]
MEHPGSVFDDVQYRPVTLTEYWRMESGTLSLVFSMLAQTLELFDLHDPSLKADVLKAYTYKFTTLFAAYSTVMAFPSASDNRIATHYGYYMSTDTVETTFGAASGAALMNGLRVDVDVKPILAPMWENRRKSVNKLSRLQVREFELAALAGILLWEHLDRMGLVTPVGEEIRSQTYADFHNEVLSKYGPIQGPVRIVKLLSFVEDVSETVASYRELELMGRIFLDAACPNAYVDPEKLVARTDSPRAT